MGTNPPGDVTVLLAAVHQGDADAKGQLWGLVYDELRAISGRLMSDERADHTLEPTALVNEAYLRLLGGQRLGEQDRRYFFGAAAQAMRRILIEHARRRTGPRRAVADAELIQTLTGSAGDTSPEALDALDEALTALAEHNQRVHDITMLRFFAGLSVEDTAEALGVSARTVKREWAYGRAWLFRKLDGADPGSA